MGADAGGPGGRCRHCLKPAADAERRRGLCRDCYATPAVRGKYQRRTFKPGEKSHAGEALTDAEVAALPPSWGDEQPPPPAAFVPEPEPRRVGDFNATVPEVGRHGAFDLHPDTAAEAIRAGHLADVRAAVARLRRKLRRPPTAAEVAADVYLAEWSVERLLAELAQEAP